MAGRARAFHPPHHRRCQINLINGECPAHGTHTMFSGRKKELSINVPVNCGGVVVNPGDFIVADMIGVTVIPLSAAREVLKLAREQAEREQKTREWVAQGKTLQDLLTEFGRL